MFNPDKRRVDLEKGIIVMIEKRSVKICENYQFHVYTFPDYPAIHEKKITPDTTKTASH